MSIFPDAEVDFSVTVTPDGRVRSVCYENGLGRYAYRYCGDAIRKWRFHPITDDRDRYFEMSVINHAKEYWELPTKQSFLFEPPSQLHMYLKATVTWRLELVDGVVPPKKCNKHDGVMPLGLVRIRYGLATGYEKGSHELMRVQRYDSAKRRKFPNSPTWVGGSCSVGDEKVAEAHICPICEKAKEK